MSDFFSSGWHWFIAVLSVGGLAFCIWLLFASAKTTDMSSDGTTGHVWDDDLREMNNPLPRWWLGLFVITVVFSAIYLFLYPGLGQVEGSLKWSSDGQYQDEMAKAQAKTAPLYQRLAAMDAPALAADAEAMGIGQRLFLNNCAQCHGSDAKGSKGFPNLSDNDWLWGGDFAAIKHSITEGRVGQMPPMAAAVGSAEDQRNLAHYVLSLSGSAHDNLRAQLGKEKFAACAACHGAKGEGNTALGAPNLSDKVWLHGWGEPAILAMIQNGKHNEMPAQKNALPPEQIHVLAAYVWSLSNR
ncbi:cytochrome-c oxidase, cbb3-type subunit III [Inhella gelatinilytica]|uniref:Cbb3-type cytochrome c oxidase subunit n=1 Tax=Inhella gelatinilytica TaxID=2795030 RepID=A0A931J2E9_9BURK|nr:cytochrome-c oxidase, cbb3-type subunit III [Inhella gelatinilytica]MBH9554101.1 cytochrome-c oxidase, cbb3-type subunit III [Inhella gelatinilytica]